MTLQHLGMKAIANSRQNRPENVNVMETFVAEEIERQLKQLPPKLSQYIKHYEVATYALNRLPPLYASCEEGVRKQALRAKNELKGEIETSVRQALAAVQRDPIRFSTPLMQSGLEAEKDRVAIAKIKNYLESKQLTWEDLAKLVEKKQQFSKSPYSTNPEKPAYPKSSWSDSRYRL
ncbi:MAG: late competence development ComFB family protein [Halothece sp.]